MWKQTKGTEEPKINIALLLLLLLLLFNCKTVLYLINYQIAKDRLARAAT